MRNEGRAFSSVRWLTEGYLPLGLCQVQLLPDSLFFRPNISLQRAPSVCTEASEAQNFERENAKAMFCYDIKLEKRIIIIVKKASQLRSGEKSLFLTLKRAQLISLMQMKSATEKKGRQMLVEG